MEPTVSVLPPVNLLVQLHTPACLSCFSFLIRAPLCMPMSTRTPFAFGKESGASVTWAAAHPTLWKTSGSPGGRVTEVTRMLSSCDVKATPMPAVQGRRGCWKEFRKSDFCSQQQAGM